MEGRGVTVDGREGWWRICGFVGRGCRVIPGDSRGLNDRPRLEVRGGQCMKPAGNSNSPSKRSTGVGFTLSLPSLRPVSFFLIRSRVTLAYACVHHIWEMPAV